MPKLVDSQIKPYEETGATDEEEWDVVRRKDVLHKRIWIRMSGICGLRRTTRCPNQPEMRSCRAALDVFRE